MKTGSIASKKNWGLSTVISAAFILVSIHPLYADWRWENDVVVAKPTPDGYEAQLIFQNKGSQDVTVTAVDFPCPCTVYTFTSTVAKPGKTGILSVVIKGEEPLNKDFDVIVEGSPSTKPSELTIRIENKQSDN